MREFVALLAEELQTRCRAAGLRIGAVSTHGNDESPRSVAFTVSGAVSAALAGFVGTHVLVARSSRRGRRARKRWFAGVSIHAQQAATAVAEIRPDEVEVTASRAGGPGGQHVNTTDSAVRVRHKASGISVRVAGERSQHRNRSVALDRLRALLGEHQQRERAERAKGRRRAHYQLERGGAVREWHLDERGAGLRPA